MRDARCTTATWFRGSDLPIGVRLTVCFLAIVLLMIAADAVALWQVRELATHLQMLNEADKASSAIVRLHRDVDSFSRQVAVLTQSHDTPKFVKEAASVRETFLRHVRDAERTVTLSPEIAQDALISSTLRTLKTTLPSQIDSEIELANAGDWPAIQFRLTGQIQDLINLSSSLADGVEERVFQQRATVNEETEQVRHRLFIVVPLAWLVTLLAAAALGWYVTRTITVPLSELTAGAEALARGDFRHEVNVGGNDELAVLGKAFDHGARQLQELYDALRRSNRELKAISNCNQVLLRATDEQSLLTEICRIVCEEAGYRMAFVAYAEHDESKSVRPVAWTGAEDLATAGVTWADTERGRGPTGTAIRSGKTCCIQDYATDPRVVPWRETALQHDFRSAIALPLKDEHANAFGSLTIFSAQPNAFTSEEVRMLEELAGDLAFGIVTLRSVATRKWAEVALRRSEAYLAESQRLSHTGSWAFSPVTTKTHYWSDETFRIWGFDPQGGPPTQEQLYERIHPEDRDSVKAISNKVVREKTDLDHEFRIVLPDGTVKHIHTTVHVVLNAGGEIVEMIGTNVDVTEPKRAEQATLEARVSERTRIARELHDTLLQSFHGLLLGFQTVFQLLPEHPVHAKDKLGSAIEQAADAITEGRDAVQGLRSSIVEGNDLAPAISALGEELATGPSNDGPAFRVAVEGEARDLHPLLRDEIYKIAAEALRNSFRHAQARQIEVEIRYDNEQFRLRVRDDGKGIDRAVLEGKGTERHFGLHGMRERATLVGAKLTVWSEVNSGTEVELRLPASTAYEKARRRGGLSRKAEGVK